MDKNSLAGIVAKDFELLPATEELPSEEAVFQMLCDRIAWLIEHNMEYLLSLLYRNDVAESKIHGALSPASADPANVALAKLVMERQRQRLETKRQYGRQSSGEVEDDLRW